MLTLQIAQKDHLLKEKKILSLTNEDNELSESPVREFSALQSHFLWLTDLNQKNWSSQFKIHYSAHPGQGSRTSKVCPNFHATFDSYFNGILQRSILTISTLLDQVPREKLRELTCPPLLEDFKFQVLNTSKNAETRNTCFWCLSKCNVPEHGFSLKPGWGALTNPRRYNWDIDVFQLRDHSLFI